VSGTAPWIRDSPPHSRVPVVAARVADSLQAAGPPLLRDLWLSRKPRRRFHQPPWRRESLGELIQIDGSEHRWFEDRAGPCTLRQTERKESGVPRRPSWTVAGFPSVPEIRNILARLLLKTVVVCNADPPFRSALSHTTRRQTPPEQCDSASKLRRRFLRTDGMRGWRAPPCTQRLNLSHTSYSTKPTPRYTVP
jgi:hypothetical protein